MRTPEPQAKGPYWRPWRPSRTDEHYPTVVQGPGMMSYGIECPCGFSTGYGLRERKAREIMHKHAGHTLTTTAVRAPGYGFTGGWGIEADCSCGERRQDPVSHRMSAVIWHEDHLTEVYMKGSHPAGDAG